MTVYRRDLRAHNLYTPSSAHEEAYQRGQAHDRMQVMVFKALGAAEPQPWLIEGVEYMRGAIVAELPLVAIGVRGRISAFADIVEIFMVPDVKRCAYRVYELKPSISSVGALIRQCRVLHGHCRERDWAGFKIVPVVMADDPMLDDLLALWNGQVVTLGDDGLKQAVRS